MSTTVITGGSMGIGLAVAQSLASRGRRLLLVARGDDALEAAVSSLPNGPHEYRAFDVSDGDAWTSVPTDGVDGLVCAAGVMQPIGALGTYDVEEFRRTLEINVVGTLLAVHHCRDALRSTRGSVVTFGGGGATGPLPRFDAYAASKAAVARLTENLAPVLAPVTINCIAPGFVATRLHEQTLAAGPEASGASFFERTARELETGGFPAAESAELVAYLLDRPPFSGKLVSAQWDPWRDESFACRLAENPDLGTIRRIDEQLFRRMDSA